MQLYTYYNGRVGQVEGTFAAGTDVINIIGQKEKIRDFKGLFKIGIQTAPYTIIEINGATIKIGASGIYELDTVNVYSLKFITEATALVDYVY